MKVLLLNQYISSAKHSSRNKRKRSSKDITDHLVRCRSSNVWGYALDIDQDSDIGTLYMQFKSATGGPGDSYRYYEFPLKLYNKLVATPSKGHFFWKYIRNNFKYSKLTGDKRGKLSNAVN